MKKLLLLLVLFISVSLSAQEIGKIFPTQEADELFGKVLTEKSMSVEELSNYISQSGSHVLFNIVDNKVDVLTKERVSLINPQLSINPDKVYWIFSTVKVEELLQTNTGKSGLVFFQQRAEHFTITYKEYTLELARPCPPCCPECE